MVDKIVYSYHFTSLANIDDLRSECKAWLITILDKFDPAKGSKAFSYFSVVTKNWFIHKVKKQTKRCQREIEYDLVAQEVYEKQVQEAINNLSIDDLNKYYKDFYGISNNASLVAIGNIDTKQLTEFFEKEFNISSLFIRLSTAFENDFSSSFLITCPL